ncbi:hypothetical protein [Patulibacter sp.]|uniref:hypothetical protein n=1 Tax=Patulibacter sp. TaxID=1912859 RepID=UPI002717ED4F|nr:hypothetical protein [Patulibacter sp.]MDO9408920.1 hypothetical protein [Patulibacter sp.]
MSTGAPVRTAALRAVPLPAVRPGPRRPRELGRSGRRRAPAGPLACCAALAIAGCGGGGGGGDDADAQRRVITTNAGTVIVRSVTDRDGLKVEVQSDSVYVSATDDTPPALLSELKGKPLGGRCTLADGRKIGTIQLLWREDPGDWGSNLAVQGVYDGGDALPREIRSCDLRRGEAAAGGTDVNAGPVLASVTFTDD